MSEIKFEEIKERHERLKGPFGFCGLTVTLESIAEYTNFCGHYFPKLLEEITRLKAKLAAAEKVVDAAREMHVDLTPNQRDLWDPDWLVLYDKFSSAVKALDQKLGKELE